MKRKALRGLAAIVALVVLLVVGAWAHLRHPLPATTGNGDVLARAMLSTVDADAWARTGAVRWTTANGTRHLWDRARGYDRFDKGLLRVWINLGTRRGIAMSQGATLLGPNLDRSLDLAYRAWINDSFWLNPVVKAFDDGVTRSVARDDNGRDALLVSYSAGGITPGDRYLWIFDAQGRPMAWRMWVSVIPIAGLEATWEGWTRLSTGAWVSTRHRVAGVIDVRVRNLAGAATLAELEPGADTFAALSR